MGFPRRLALKNPPVVPLGTLDKCENSGLAGAPMELEGIHVAKNMMTTKENIVLPPPMETNNIPLAPSNTLSWAYRVENSTPSWSPGTSSCPDGGQIPSTPPIVEQQLHLTARFFIIKKNDDNFLKVSPFLIHKAITSAIGAVKTIRKMRFGDLFLEVTSSNQASALMNLKKMAHFDITIELDLPQKFHDNPGADIIDKRAKQNRQIVLFGK
ncbi:hypothetical protein TNCT_60531 [Trichonephila clavata]|uniref:Uncharacterized protein n=1 Tax=Trichonephila clavata TaxID=2740835 RepID=A0A8X6FDA5_TRICU|nr:hypothetical protein TNCT_60531 [Trichonephila clavata]